jgi:cytochrome P450
MPKAKLAQTVEQRMDAAVSDALAGSGPDVEIDQLARRVITENAALLGEYLFQEVVRRLRREKIRQARQDRDHYQLPLPGFERLPQTIRLAGKRRPLQDATYRELRQYLAALHQRHREDPKIAEVQKLIDMVKKYAANAPRITVKEAAELEAKKKAGK